MRNDLVHGARVYSVDECKEKTKQVLELINHAITKFSEVYGFNGWKRVAVRINSKLHSDPKVNLN